MDNYSMNNAVPEQDRSCDIQGFENVSGDVTSPSMPTVPYHGPTPVSDAVTRTSNTQKIQVGPSAGEITGRTRNG